MIYSLNFIYFWNTTGTCELNHLIIYAVPQTYYLSVFFDGYKDNIKLNFDQFEINVENCKENQVRLFDEKQVPYCENPKCYNDCPVGVRAECIAHNSTLIGNTLINNEQNNECRCLPGFTGNKCSEKEYIDFR